MMRVSSLFAILLMLAFAAVSFAGLTPEKAAHDAAVENAKAIYVNGGNLTAEQVVLLEGEGIVKNSNSELDRAGGPDTFGYSYSDSDELNGPTYEWIDISETGTEVTNWSDDTNIGPFDLGFDFPFYGVNYNQFWMCSNGWITFSDAQGTAYNNAAIPTPAPPNNMIAWCWDDWRPSNGQMAYIGMSGDDFVIQFAMGADNYAGVMDAEVILSPNGTIKVQYGSEFEVRADNVTVGLENSDATDGIQVCFNDNNAEWPHPEMALVFQLEDMGSISGIVYDEDTENAIADAEVFLMLDGEFYRSTFTDDRGGYSLLVDIGDYTIAASAFGYIDSEPVPVTVVVDENVEVDIPLAMGDSPEISVDPETLEFTVPWMGQASDVITVVNTGGLPLEWYIDFEIFEDEELAIHREEEPRRFEVPTAINLPSEADLQGASEEKRQFYSDLEDAFNDLQNNTPLTLEKRTLLANQGILPQIEDELDREGGPDEFGYIYIDNMEGNGPRFDWLDISQTGTEVLGMGDDGTQGPFDIPFPFPFYGEDKTQIWFGYNGSVGFNNGVGTLSHDALPNPNAPNDAIQFWQRDMHCGYGFTSVFYETIELYGMECFVVEYNNISQYGAERVIEFTVSTEILLFEDGTILVQYGYVGENMDAGTMTVGIDNMNGTDGLEYSYNSVENAPVEGTVIAYAVGGFNFGWISCDPSSGVLFPEEEQEVIVTVDASVGELAPGVYEGLITVSTDFPNVESDEVWVTMTVEEPGSIQGGVFHAIDNTPVPHASVFIVEEEEDRLLECDENGLYHVTIGEGEYSMYANADGYDPSEPVIVEVINGEVTTQNFYLNEEIPAEIIIDEQDQNLVFEIEWGEIACQTILLTNDGGLDLNFATYIEYQEDEEPEMNIRQRILNHRATMDRQVAGNTIVAGPSSHDFNVVPTANHFAELDDPYILIFQDQVPWANTHTDYLNELEIAYDQVGGGMMATQELDEYTAIMIPSCQGQRFYDTFMQNEDRFEEFVLAGGWLEYHGCTQGSNWTLWDGTRYVHESDRTNHIVEPDHPMVFEVPAEITGNSANHGWMDAVPEEALVIATDTQDRPVLIEKRHGRGNMIVTTTTMEIGANLDPIWGCGLIMYNMIDYTLEGAMGAGGWLTVDPMEGVLTPEEDIEITFCVNAEPDSLFAGVYEARVDFYDPLDERVVEQSVWVTLVVNGGPPRHHMLPMMQPNYFELVSTYLNPERFSLDAAEVFGGLESLVIAYQSDGGNYIPEFPINTIGDIDITQAYRLFCTEGEQLHVQGDYINLPETNFTIVEDIWNWIGYPYDIEIPVEVLLAPMMDDVVIVMNDRGELFIPELINTLGVFTPGDGYMVITSETLVFTFLEMPAMLAGAPSTEYWDLPVVEDAPAASGLPYAVLAYLDENVLASDAASIEIYDGKTLVGKSLILEDRDFTPVTAWEGNADYDISGFTPGNDMTIVVKSADGNVLPTVINGTPAFGEGAYASVEIGMSEALPTEFAVSQGYPNPFNPSVTIPFALPGAGEVSFKVFNILGQQVYNTSAMYEAGHHKFMFNASNSGSELVSGVYFLQVKSGSQIQTQKLMLLK